MFQGLKQSLSLQAWDETFIDRSSSMPTAASPVPPSDSCAGYC